ncbi:MAG: aquaporin [Halobacteria archaeon]
MATALRACVAEAFGTAVLTLFGSLSVAMAALPGYAAGPIGPALAHGLVIAVMVYAIGPVSGCCINPAITLAMAAHGKIGGKTAALYILFQLIGAAGAGLLLYGSLHGTPMAAQTYYGGNRPDGGLGVGEFQTAFIEAFGTALLAFAVFAVPGRAPAGVGGFAIGTSVAVAVLAVGPLTGASLNPARTFGPALVSALAGLPNALPAHWAYWMGPIAGALFGSFIAMRVIGEKETQ